MNNSLKRSLSALLTCAALGGSLPAAAGGQTAGFYNADSTLLMELSARYDSGVSDPDGGVTEIVACNTQNGFAYIVNGSTGMLTAMKPGDENVMPGVDIDVRALVEGEDSDFSYGDMTSVAVSADGTLLAAALQDSDYKKPGRAAFFTFNQDGTLAFHGMTAVGVQPDMITFTPDGSKVLTADEGEPREGYESPAADPAGSVTIIDTETLAAAVVDFTGFDAPDARAALVADSVLLKSDTAPSVDLEPEYIAVSGDGTTAYVTLQEANSIAVLDIGNKTFTAVHGLGFKDHGQSGNEIDLYRDGRIDIRPESGYYGIYMPDGVTLFEKNGKTYLLTANEGDGRDWPGFCNEADKVLAETGRDGGSKAIELTVHQTDGYDGFGETEGKTFLFGGRSVSLWDAADMSLVWDSGAQIESVTAEVLPEVFNWSNDDDTFDKRSAKKGPEPENVLVGTVGEKVYAFAALERIGGIMAWDISNPEAPVFANYINTRDFSAAVAGDVAPEGLAFSEGQGGQALLLAAHEVSGTVTAYRLAEAPSDSTPQTGGESVVQKPSVQTVHNTDGTRTTIVTADDGTITESTLYPSGAVVETLSSPAGQKTITVTVPENRGPVTVFIPAEEVTAASVVEYKNADGSWEAVAKCAPGKNGVTVLLERSAEVRVSQRAPAFADVAPNAWYAGAVDFTFARGLFTGAETDAFSPEQTMSRAMLVTVLHRLEGQPAATQDHTFDDVSAEAYYAGAVAWAEANGIVNGTGDGFQPEAAITREELACILYRNAKAQGVVFFGGKARLSDFRDADEVSDWASQSMSWAVSTGLLSGKENRTLDPQGSAQRAEVAAILMRYIEMLAD